jgi:hypothetical protein
LLVVAQSGRRHCASACRKRVRPPPRLDSPPRAVSLFTGPRGGCPVCAPETPSGATEGAEKPGHSLSGSSSWSSSRVIVKPRGKQQRSHRVSTRHQHPAKHPGDQADGPPAPQHGRSHDCRRGMQDAARRSGINLIANHSHHHETGAGQGHRHHRIRSLPVAEALSVDRRRHSSSR